MSRRTRRVLFAVAALALGALLVWALLEGREEKKREREREEPVQARSLLSRGPGGEVWVAVDSGTVARLGLGIEPLTESVQRPAVTAYGQILDPTPLSALQGELSSAEAALAASRAEYERTKVLYQEGENASLRAVELAEAQFRADQNRVRVAARQIATGWGEDIASLAPSARERLVVRIIAGQSAVARVNLPAGDILRARPRGAKVVALGYEDRPLAATGIREASSVDPGSQGQGFLLRLESHGFPLRPGTAVTAQLTVPGAPRSGLVIPRGAVVRYAGKAWAYVEVRPGAFARREIPLDHSVDRGWLLPAHFAAGDRVISTGAQALLSEELKSQIQIEGDGGEEREREGKGKR